MRYILALGATVLLMGCETRIPKEDYVAYYDEKCKTEMERSGVRFFAIPLTYDYEIAKWGTPLDSGMRVVVGATPRSDLSFEDAFLIRGKDTTGVVLTRKMQTFELGAADMFVLSFADRIPGAKLRLKNVSQGIGGVEIELKNCQKIRLEESK